MLGLEGGGAIDGGPGLDELQRAAAAGVAGDVLSGGEAFVSNVVVVANNGLQPLSLGGDCSPIWAAVSVLTQTTIHKPPSMLTTRTNRLDPSLIPPEQLERMARLFASPDHILLTDSAGNQAEMPQVLFQHFARIVRLMSERKAIVMLPEDEAFTTQAAANYLGMSRQFFVNLLEKGEIPFHRVGAHRRVTFKDLLEYEKKRDKARRESMDRLTDEVHKAGLYFSDYQGDA